MALRLPWALVGNPFGVDGYAAIKLTREEREVAPERSRASARPGVRRSGATLLAVGDAAGDTWFIPGVLNAAFKVHISEAGDDGVALHPAELLHMATVAGARARDLEDRIGNFDPGWSDRSTRWTAKPSGCDAQTKRQGRRRRSDR